jgi:hypothetical protein
VPSPVAFATQGAALVRRVSKSARWNRLKSPACRFLQTALYFLHCRITTRTHAERRK